MVGVRSGGVEIGWPNKAAAAKQADTLARTTAREFESLSGNALIQGDNLDALKELRRVGHRRYRLALIDPPYNTGGGFVYEDDRSEAAWLSFMLPRLLVARDAGEIPESADIDLVVSFATGSWYALALAGEPVKSDWPQRTARLMWQAAGGHSPAP